MLCLALLFCAAVSEVTAIPLANFYSFGTSAGGSTLGPTDDGRSSLIALNAPFLYFGTNYNDLAVSNNGFITTSASFSQFNPERFDSVSVPLIAPYWADVDTGPAGGGLVWYRVSTSQADRDRARNDIRAVFREAARFTPTVVFIATWDHVGYYNDHVDKTNTFQCILASDGSQSYVIFLYADGLIQWTTGDSSEGSNGFGGNHAHVGLTSGNGVDFITHEYSFTSQVVDIETARVPDSVLVDGVLMYRVDGNTDPFVISMISPDQLHTRGDSATFRCEAVEEFESEISWLRGEIELSEETGRVEIDNTNNRLSVLTLLNVTAADGGEYTCRVSTEVGTSFAVTQLFISPYFTTLPEDTTGANGTAATLTCEAEGYPEPEYQWSRADGIPFIAERVAGQDSVTLEINLVLFSDRGVYVCNVTSGEESIESNSTLTVSPEGGVQIISIGQPDVNSTVSLLCVSQGGPGNMFTWSTAPDEESEFTETFGPNVVINGDELIITNVRFSVGRAYKCDVSNAAGSGSKVITLADPDGAFDEFLPFYDLSGLPGVQELPRTQDSHSPPIFVPGGLVYGTEEITQVYVNENGAFSFNSPWRFSHPNRYPTNYLPARQSHVLSPFWSDVDIRKEGTVRYVPIKRGSTPAGDLIMNEASAYVNYRLLEEGESTFRPTWLLVAQWDGVHPHPHGADDREGVDEEYLEQTNTFQGVLITDTIQSYYVFSFTCGEINWSGQGSETAIVGYNSKGDFFLNHPANGFADVGRIISCTRYMIPEGGRKKRQTGNTEGAPSGVFPADRATQEAKSLCRDFADSDDASFQDIDALKDNNDLTWQSLSQCPPTKAQLEISTEFEPFPHQGDSCYRSKNTFKPLSRNFQRPYEFVSVCCYERFGAIIRTGNDAGRITEIGLDDIALGGTNSFDLMFFKTPCCGNLCSRYENKRPLSLIAPETGGTRGAGGNGDPHYTTFDNVRYDFVAAGEFTLFGVNNDEGTEIFRLQGRLGPRGWPATTTVALAFGVPGVYAYQFVHNDEAVLLQTFPTVEEIGGIVDNDYLTISRFANAMTADIKVLNIRIVATWNRYNIYRYINYQVFVPRFLCQVSFGHLGSCDDNPANDYASPNDYRIGEAETMFTYGVLPTRRKRTAGDGIFAADEMHSTVKRQIHGPDFVCTSFDNCGDHNFVGVTFEELSFTEEQMAMCNNDETCLYDLALTGDMGFAQDTLDASEENMEVQQVIRNSPPNITGDEIFYVNVGEENVYTFTVNDTNDFNVTIAGGVPEGGVLNDEGDGVYTFTWTPPATPTDGVSFVATDIAGAATVHTPVLRVCACFNGGTCTEEGVPVTNMPIQILTCFCDEAYSGPTCSEDKNGCAEVECFAGVECFDIPAPGVGAECGPCETGFTGDGLKCIDLDECAENDTLCDQICENTFGSYVCNCEPGYTLVDNALCEDIDECSGANDCEQGCVNTPGSYNCTCGAAFNLDEDGRTCNPRTVCGPNSCSHICAVDEGQDTCFCPAGLELAPGSTTTCQDIDECQRFSPCDQICSNTLGSFECSCDTGYQLQNDTQICEDIDECLEAALASFVLCTELNAQCVNTDGSFECVCVDGYELVDGECKRIVNEVIEPPQVSVPMIAEENTIMFVIEAFHFDELTAEVLQEFRVVTAKAVSTYCAGMECVLVTFDGDESSSNVTVSPQHIAIPVSSVTSGADGRPVLSFYVQLSRDTVVSSNVLTQAVQEADNLYRDARLLPDINECDTDNGGCNQTCTNTHGSFQCSCEEGFTLAADKLDCDDVNECATSNGGCEQMCTNTRGSFECSCGVEYVLATDNKRCVEKDACEVNGSLYFELNGAVYQPGSSILITDVGTANSAADADMSLICVTSEVNSQCCRGSDGGNAGEWYFPDGSIVPRARNDPNGDFTRSGFTEQVRLNRRNDAAAPTGVYTCAVPREDGCPGPMHTAHVTLGLPFPVELQSFCAICLWKPSPGRFDSFVGYDIRYFNSETNAEIVTSTEESEFYKVTAPEVFELGQQDQLMVQVRVRLSDSVVGPYTEPTVLCPTV